jgi:transcriptional regulator with XRE-family HTH domain
MATVREYRLRAGLSKSELCKRADVDFQTLTRAENGEPIQEHNAQKIANALSTALGQTIEIRDLEGLSIYRP